MHNKSKILLSTAIIHFLLGMGKVLLTIVIFSISIMMIFSILPAMALHAGDGSKCPGEPRSPWEHISSSNPNVDKNGNGFICNLETGRVIIQIDDLK